MPIHDWTRVPSGLFHDFHQTWSIHLKTALNSGILPKGLSALVEQRAVGREPDVLAVYRTAKEIYASRANRVVVKHHLGRVVAVIEIFSPGNKDSRAAIREFVGKAVELLQSGIHLLLVDLFPPTPRDVLGIHKLIWDEISDEPFRFPPGKDRLLVSYELGTEQAAYVQTLAVGDALPQMPLFVAEGVHVKTPLEATYRSAWYGCPEELRSAVETGILPQPE